MFSVAIDGNYQICKVFSIHMIISEQEVQPEVKPELQPEIIVAILRGSIEPKFFEGNISTKIMMLELLEILD